MPIFIKREPEIAKMRKAGLVTSETMLLIKEMIKPGNRGLDINNAAHEFIKSKGGVPSFLHYRNFPKSICFSINEEILHGIPSKRILKEGDIVCVDVGVMLDGFHTDMARTFAVGKVSKEAQRLIDVTEKSFFESLKVAKVGHNLYEISAVLEDVAVKNGYTVLQDYFGHGIGRKLHEDPDIPCSKQRAKGPRLMAGMTLAVEPMVCAGKNDVYTAKDDWTVITKDGCLTAHYENTFLITDGEPELLTY